MMNQVLLNEIIIREWEMFQQVNNVGGRAPCQDDRKTFAVMRKSQFETWPKEILQSYLDDLKAAKAVGRNLVMEKYAHMMAYTHPREYEGFKDLLPSISPETAAQIEKIVLAHVYWKQSLEGKYPNLNNQGRPLTSDQDSPWVTSFETYLRGELQTYSAKTVALYSNYIEECQQAGRNLAEENLRAIIKSYGYQSLEEAEAAATPRR